jgi:hypothetical protein
MYHETRQKPLKEGRRISLNVNLAPDIIEELGAICSGNRSAAIEKLVRDHLARTRDPELTPA